MKITTIGIDLAKNIFQVHGVTEDGSVAFNKPLRRARVLPFFAKLEPCLIGIEACSSAHYWGRELTALGHDVKLMPPSYVKPYVKRGKSDAADAEAICEAVTRPTMRFVQIKSAEQQALLSQHRAREMLVGQRTQISNTIRGLVGEFGITIRKGLEVLQRIWTQRRTLIFRLSHKMLLSHCHSTYWRSTPVLWIWIKRLRQARSRIIASSSCKRYPVLGRSMRRRLSPLLATRISLRTDVT